MDRDSANDLFYVEKGQVKLTVVSKRGKEAVVAILHPDDFVGEGCLAGEVLRMASATALTECAIVRLEKASAIRALRDDPAFSELFLAFLLARNIRTQEDLVDQLFNSSEKRLARVLLFPGVVVVVCADIPVGLPTEVETGGNAVILFRG